MTQARKHTLGLVAKHKRIIVSGAAYERFFPKPSHTDPILNPDGDVQDTVKLAADIVLKTLSDTKLIAPVLKRESLDQTCKAIFDFFYTHYQYREDKKGVEQLRRPARAWADRKEGIDCDCFSISISSILTNLNIPHYFRIVKMYGRDYYQHIYVIVPKYKGADIKRRNNYLVIDPVLDQYELEAPGISEKKDYQMNGIPIQFLNGLGCPQPKRSLMGFGSEFEGLGRWYYNPIAFRTEPGMTIQTRSFHRPQSVNAQDMYDDFLRRKRRHLINTRNLIARNPHLVRPWFRPRVLLGQIDEILGAWDNDQAREATLTRLAGTEHEAYVNGLAGLGALGGFWSKLKNIGNKIKDGVKSGAKWVAKQAKSVAKVILKYNPLSIAARAGFRLAMKVNFGYLAGKAYWGYFSESEAKAKNVSASYWRKAKELKDKIEHVFVDLLKGEAGNLRDDILKGGSKRAAGGNLRGTQGLGVVAESAIATAMAFIGPLIVIAKKIFGGGGGDEENASNAAGGGNADAGTNAGSGPQPSDDPGNAGGGSYNAPQSSGGGAYPAGDEGGGGQIPDNGGAPGGGIAATLSKNKNLLLIAGLAVGGILLMKASGNSNPPQPAPYYPPPQPAPPPAPVPQPQYVAMGGVKRKRREKPAKKEIKVVKLT